MKIALLNGSPKEKGCTYTALSTIAQTLEELGVESKMLHIGRDPIRGCQACGGCMKKGDGHCVFDDDVVNSIIDELVQADGIIVGSPVYYAGTNGALHACMDRVFYAACPQLRFKPAAAIASARRAGTTLTIDQINKYFQINCMPVVSSTYWPMVHGTRAEEVLEDEEGLQTMRNLATNMVWMVKCIQAGQEAGIGLPEPAFGARTNFIR